ncbi:hypothetical protein METY_3409 [Methylopila sp. Yamaguchi]|nr:hypothetical protein METY_3409 [Methylopila sp. Yamaguchi]
MSGEMDDFDEKADTEERLARQQSIGAELRQVFDDVQAEPVPENLLELARLIDRRLGGEREPARLTLVASNGVRKDR